MSALIDWDRLPTETPKSYAAFLAYVALGARRSVREAARQHHSKALSAGEILGQGNTTVSTWLAWSSKHKWVSRANARDDWIAHVSDEQIVANIKACHLALTTRGCPTAPSLACSWRGSRPKQYGRNRASSSSAIRSRRARSGAPGTKNSAPGVCCSRDGAAAVQSGPPKSLVSLY